ncbi:MAG: molybdenum cofactor guanylyltransferase MobA [Pseudomonadota bacterium]
MMLERQDITAVILAGGQGRRLGGQDKGLIEFNGRPIIESLIEQLQTQSVDLVINANRNQEIYQQYGYPVFSDQLKGFQGPLAGFATAMARLDSRYMLTAPCDGPKLANDYVERFRQSQQNHQSPICVAHDGERLQPVHALIQVDLLDSLKQFLESGDRKIDRWYAQHDYQTVDFSNCRDMFKNINTESDQQALQAES